MNANDMVNTSVQDMSSSLGCAFEGGYLKQGDLIDALKIVEKRREKTKALIIKRFLNKLSKAENKKRINIKLVLIPACEIHEGIHALTVHLRWICPICGGERGEIHRALSYDGSRRLVVSGWNNPCGHIDKYADVLEEAKKNGFNEHIQNLEQVG